MAANQDRKDALPGVLAHPAQQARPLPQCDAGREGLGLELFQLRMGRSGK